MFACLALAAGTAAAAQAQAPAAPVAAAVHTFHIAAGPLARALEQFSAQSGLQVLYDPALVRGRTAARIDGARSVGAVLDALLKPDGFIYEFTDPITLVVKRAPRERPVMQARVPVHHRASAVFRFRRTLPRITVTGSLIPPAQIETSTPVTSIPVRQMEQAGFGSVYQILRTQPLATGAVEDNQYAGGFTESAETISLLGLAPEFTMYLLDGHPMAEYPLPYDGSSTFVDLASVPTAMVRRIDIVPGSLSSIYGSSALAGVVNFVLRHHMDGYELNVRDGGFSNGGGNNQRVEFLGGYNSERWKVVYGVQLENQRPIWNYQQKLTAASTSNPDPSGRFATPTYSDQYVDPASGQLVYRDPGAAACAGLSNLVGGTTGYDSQPDAGLPINPGTGQPSGPGYYCGSPDQKTYTTSLNQDKSGTGYLDASWRFADHTELYATLLANTSSMRFSPGPYFWTSNLAGGGMFINAATGDEETLTHVFAPEEIGDWRFNSAHALERGYNTWFGARGEVGDWHYDAFFARSQQNLIEKQWWPVTNAVDDFFQNRVLGPSLGVIDGLPVYDPDYANFYKAITPAQYASFDGLIYTHSQTWNQNFNLRVTNDDLFALPGGAAALAGLFQYGDQVWSNPTDPGVVNGEFYGLTGASGGGARNNWAFASELRMPVLAALTVDLSARYDHYGNHGGGADGDLTYKLGLAFRPSRNLLLRANYGTGFRAPDMAYVFGGESGGYENNLTDYYQCALVGGALDQCPYYANQDVLALHKGNRYLKSITAKSFGAGVVWSPVRRLELKADYYNIRIANAVQLQDIDALLKTEAACRLAQLDPHSPTCIAALAQVQRAPSDSADPGSLIDVRVFPINVAREAVSGVIAAGRYRFRLGRFGRLVLRAQYNVTLKHTQQQYPFDPVHDLLRDPFYSSEFKNIASASATWRLARFSATLYGTRYGRTANAYAQSAPTGYATPCTTDADGYVTCAGTVAPWTVFNGSVTYRLGHGIRVSAIVNNLANAMPPGDYTSTSSPYFNPLNYNAYGREYWLDLDWRFGR